MDNMFKLAVFLTAIDHLSGPLRTVGRALADVDKMAQKADGMIRWGKGAAAAGLGAAYVSDRIAGTISPIVRQAMAVEDAAAIVSTVIPATAGTVAQATERTALAAREWSRMHMDSQAEFLRTTYQMLSAGLSEKEAIAATERAMIVARATMGNSFELAQLLGAVYNNLGDKQTDAAREMERIGDIVGNVQRVFQFPNMAPFIEGMKHASKTAVMYRIDLADVATVLGQLNSSSITGSMAGTAFTAMIFKMQEASRKLHFAIARTKDGGIDFIGTLANMEKRFGSLDKLSPRMQQKLQDVFGIEGSAIAVLLGKSAELMRLRNSYAPGIIDAAARTVEGTGSGQLQIMRNNLDGIYEVLGSLLLPSIKEVTPYVQTIADKVGEFIKESPGVVKVGLGFAAVSAAALAAVSPILTSAGALLLFSGYSLRDFPKIIDKVWSLGRAFIDLGKTGVTAIVNLGGKIPFLLDQGRLLGSLIGVQIVNSIRAAALAVKAFTIGLLTNPIFLAITAIIVAAVLIYKYWEPISGFFKSLWQKVKPAFQDFAAWAMGWIRKTIDFFSGLWTSIKSLFDGGISGIVQLLLLFSPAGILMAAFLAVRKLLGDTNWYREGAALVQGLINGITEKAAHVFSAVSSIASGITERIRKLLGISSPSAVFQAFGGNIVTGLARGIQASEGLAVSRVGKLARSTMAAAAIALPAATIVAAPTAAVVATRIPEMPVLSALAAPAIAPAVISAPGVRTTSGTVAEPAGRDIQLHFNPTINLTGGAEITPDMRAKLLDMFRTWAYHFAQILKDEEHRQRRRDY
jgi:TP901 family phage tail tape measure protein